jgi:rRNA maturation RNase YbeY
LKKNIAVFHQHAFLRYPTKKAIELAGVVIRSEKFFAENINIIFVSDKQIKFLHHQYLQLSTVTDVITFRYNEGEKIDGEIYICLDQAQRQSKIYEQTFTQEVSRLIVHGALHLVGYSDNTESLRKSMREKENFYLHKSGII